jgi:hypothetical protein
MNTELSPEAAELGAVVRESITAAGGVGLLRAAAADPARRAAVDELLDPLGVWDLSPADDQVEFEAAASVARAAGAFGLPYPVVERLGRVAGSEATALVPRGGAGMVMHADLPLRWSGIDLTGERRGFQSVHPRLVGTKLAPFGVDVVAGPAEDADPAAAARLITLQSWWLLGLLEQALADTVQYTTERVQFGRTLSRFQSVGFTLADMSIATQSLVELAKYTLWSVAQGGDELLADAIGLHVAALSAADLVLRGAHQLHGAMGFTDEVAVSWLSKVSQGPRRLPEGAHESARILAELVGRDGLRALGSKPSAVVP